MQDFYEKKCSNSCLKNMTFFLYNVYFLILYIFNYEDSLAFYIPDTHSSFAILGFNVVLSCILKLTFTFVFEDSSKSILFNIPLCIHQHKTLLKADSDKKGEGLFKSISFITF